VRELLAPRPQRVRSLGGQAHELRALLRLERAEDVAEEELPLRRDPRDEPLAGAREADRDRAPVSGLVAPRGQSRRLETVDEPGRCGVVDPDAVRELTYAQAAALGEQVEGPQLARRQARGRARVECRKELAAAEDGPELVPALRELGRQRLEVTTGDICNLQKLHVAA
jgi:hypothetical protein